MTENDLIPSQYSILVVDDTPANLSLLTQMLEKRGYNARPLPSGQRALQAAKINPPDLILLDINMPNMDGYDVCEKLKADKDLKDIPVIFISAVSDTMDKVRTFQVGGIDFISKPFHFEEVNARVETHLKLHKLQMHLEELVQEKTLEISASQISTIYALAKLAESRDDITGKHIDRVRAFSKIIAESLRDHPLYSNIITDEYINDLYHAAPLHDIGKVGIKDAILLKPGKLTKNECEIVKTHTTIGAQTLEVVRDQYSNNSLIDMGIEIARSHHERWDGSGYPDGLKKEEIPLHARILTISDVYDALRSERTYKIAFSHEKSIGIIKEGNGTFFDPGIMQVFSEFEKKFADTFEKLKN